MKQLSLKDLSRDLKTNCAISYYFYLYLMFNACAARFDVIKNLVKFWIFECIKRPKLWVQCDETELYPRRDPAVFSPAGVGGPASQRP